MWWVCFIWEQGSNQCGIWIKFSYLWNGNRVIWTELSFLLFFQQWAGYYLDKKSWQTADETNYNTMRMKGKRQNNQIKIRTPHSFIVVHFTSSLSTFTLFLISFFIWVFISTEDRHKLSSAYSMLCLHDRFVLKMQRPL